METRGGGDGSRPRCSGLPTLKKDAAGRDRTSPRDAIRRQRERPYANARRRETPSQTTQKKRGEAPNRTEKERRREAPTRDTKEGRGKKRLKSHPRGDGGRDSLPRPRRVVAGQGNLPPGYRNTPSGKENKGKK
ncbi:hypothetical protein NDU88_003443 [Pleurodeles waltl]|uniref:Uncharacterized protein n=1 Tax=Pleurodeles waltl TaxID=8319 RepID=A0AAV7N054_PLEWA|nr:hypothetical protein NDU88_003443 [Pleurodeles waltl]